MASRYDLPAVHRAARQSSAQRARGLLEIRFEASGPPQPKQRARRGKSGIWYTPIATRRYEQHVALAALEARLRCPGWRLDASYSVELDMYFGDARRRDADNCAKACLDAANAVLWGDDSQVTSLLVRKHLDRERPRIEVVVRHA